MDLQSLKNKLERNYIFLTKPATVYATYDFAPNDNSIINLKNKNTNRSAAGWLKANIIIQTNYDPNKLSDYLAGWQTVVGNYTDQFLILIDKSNNCFVYDASGKHLGDESIIDTIINTVYINDDKNICEAKVLDVGDSNDNNSIVVVRKDRLCYQVQNESRGSKGIRTISKSILQEFCDSLKGNPNATADELRKKLSGLSDNDKYEYGYCSTLIQLAKMCLAKVAPDSQIHKSIVITNNDKGTQSSHTVSRFSLQEFLENDPGKENFLSAVKTKPFLLLAGISGTGKSRIVREMAFASCPEELQDADGTTPGNYCMIEVKPNWNDSTELLGYYSNLNGKYMFTKFTNFLVKAMQHPETPFFVCLDEMNLAPVEQYFAEYLSVLETRKKVGERIVTGALVDKAYFNQLKNLTDGTDNSKLTEAQNIANAIGLPYSETELAKSLAENGLTLPDNVIVVGTVNMDDTTHQFSRKVIDRAMTIEMNGGKLEDMFGGASRLSYREDPAPLGVFKAEYVSADDALENSELSACADVVKEKLPQRLYAINECLAHTPFQVSYRVLNEMVIYLAVLADEKSVVNIDSLIDQAVDDITLMKILPRIEGDEEMFQFAKGEKVPSDTDNKLQWLSAIMPSDGRSQKKLEEMDQRLHALSFTRFWP